MGTRRLWLWGALLSALWVLLLMGLTRWQPPRATEPVAWAWLWYRGRLAGPAALGPEDAPEQVLEALGLPARLLPQVRLWGHPQWRLGDPLPAASSLVFWVPQAPGEATPPEPLPAGWVPPDAWPPPEDATVPPLASGTLLQGESLRALAAAARFVGEALAQHRLAPQGLDRVVPEETAAWPVEEPVRRVRVWEEVVLEQSTIPFEVTYQPLPEEPIDTLKVVHPGTVGIQAREVLVRYEDGQEVARIPLGEWVLQPPQPRVVGYGTRITIQTLQTPDGPIQYWRAVRVYATSYSPCRVYGPDGPCDDITASGERLRKGIIAVRLSWYRYMKGMRVYVPDYGFGIIADVGGGLGDRLWIDLGFSEEDYEPWARWTTLYFLAPPPPPDRILWILPP